MIDPMRISTVLISLGLLLGLVAGCPTEDEPDGALADASFDAMTDGDALPTDGRVGDPCTEDEDCLFTATNGRVVCLRRSWGFRDGYCTIVGPQDLTECEAASAEAKYVALPCARSVCMQRCVNSNDCRQDYECLPTLEACWPRCEAGRACPLPPPNVCEFDNECDDADPCTQDGCVDGICAHDRITTQPRRVARLATRGPAIDVDFTGSLAEDNLGLLVAEGDEGVQAIDLGNPSVPAVAFQLETVGRAVAVTRHGNRIAVAEELAGLEFFPAAGGSAVGAVLLAEGVGSAAGLNPNNPWIYAYRHGAMWMNVEAGAVSGPCDTRGRAVDGVWFGTPRILLVADSLAGLAICSWPESGDPFQRERIDSDGRMLGLAYRETVMVAAEGGAGVGVFDVSDPVNPNRRAMTPALEGEAVDVRMPGRSTFMVAASEGGIYAFALSDCYVPELWYQWETDGPALSIDEQDGVLAVAMGEVGIDLLDTGCRPAPEDE